MIGIETEYGIYVEGKGASDLVSESTHFVQAYPHTFATGWDYRFEFPRRDVRGFTVDRLSVDPRDAAFEQVNQPHSTDREVRADRVLTNGARLYNDHGHPEYATPECGTIVELIAHDRAGERVMWDVAKRRMHQMGGTEVSLYKNNTDFHGSSYGTHESYLTGRDVPFERILAGLLPFFVTRQLFAGAGKVGCEEAGVSGVTYQLSQRADFFTTLASVDTLYNRPIVNTRDEAHTNEKLFRRLHVICGDANLCEVAQFLKVGTTLLTLRLIEQNQMPQIELENPVAAIKVISRDNSFRWQVKTKDGKLISGIDIQRLYLDAACKHLRGLSTETDLVLGEWESVLDTLTTDPLSLSDTLDWVAKHSLVYEYRENENLAWTDTNILQSVDLAYHNIDPDAGLYLALEQAKMVRRMVTDEAIETAVISPPTESPRARVRGHLVSQFNSAIRAISWSMVQLEIDGQIKTFMLDDLATKSAQIERAKTPVELARVLGGEA
jgi:Pup amidohydrolase